MWILTVILQGGRCYRFGNAIAIEEFGEVNIVACFNRLTYPLAVTNDHIKGVTLHRPFGPYFVVIAGPRLLYDGDFYTSFGFIFVADLLQIVGGVPLGPPNR